MVAWGLCGNACRHHRGCSGQHGAVASTRDSAAREQAWSQRISVDCPNRPKFEKSNHRDGCHELMTQTCAVLTLTRDGRPAQPV